ncbi:UDP-glycosyltransferase 78D2 [Platanthera zijinensis]|uniref:Glycosyltransferase n=1 Tax=Platanthera zijinensis TaxID=2320716 RepID=A0AAP0AY18_9ASPA
MMAPHLLHIVMFAFPFDDHVGQLYALARALASAVPEATFSFVSTNETIISLPRVAENLHCIPFEDGVPDLGPSARVIERILYVAPEKIKKTLKKAVASAGGLPVTCVLSDAFVWPTESVAEEMRLPWIALFSGFPLAMLAHIHTGDLHDRFGVEEQVMPALAEEPLDFIPGLAAMRICDLPVGILFGGTTTDYALHFNGMGNSLLRAAAVVVPTLAGFDHEQYSTMFAKLKKGLLIGPLNLVSPLLPCQDREGCIRWLSHRPAHSVAYISFGTVVTLPGDELAEFARGLEDTQVRFLWFLKSEHRSWLPEGFEERTWSRGKLVSWVPQLPVLCHPAVAVFVTNCGWSSALESISAGVPMLCRPIFGDQRMVARALEEIWGAGTELDEPITRISFMAAMEGIMKGTDGKRMRKRAQKLRERTREAMLPGGRLSENFNALVEFVRRC